MARIDDWQIYVNDPDRFDEDHFASSLVDNDPEFHIPPETMFSFAKNGPTIVSRINDLKINTSFNGMYYLPRHASAKSEKDLLLLCENCVSILAKYARSRSALQDANALENAKYKIVKDSAYFHDQNIDTQRSRTDAFMNLEHEFSDKLLAVNECYFAASEAVLAMTNMPMIKNYILKPDVEMDVEFRPFYDLYLGGGQFTDFSDEIVLLIP